MFFSWLCRIYIMPVFSHDIVITTKAGVDVHDITGEVQDFLSSTKLEKGVVCAYRYFVFDSNAGEFPGEEIKFYI